MPYYPEGYKFGKREGQFLIFAALAVQLMMGLLGLFVLGAVVYLGIKMVLS